ncbi:CLUMA_CG002140, isoform A [Clunio marinus]|uniref:CLUMA_CG002140, isoform A n=1 Tax=Clunio marinus TaxID=568069 RepID=A0A1J1HKB2_9DIPT|nr:CLUMA_CG002140, isoform A [Clunio marinus]
MSRIQPQEVIADVSEDRSISDIRLGINQDLKVMHQKFLIRVETRSLQSYSFTYLAIYFFFCEKCLWEMS